MKQKMFSKGAPRRLTDVSKTDVALEGSIGGGAYRQENERVGVPTVAEQVEDLALSLRWHGFSPLKRSHCRSCGVGCSSHSIPGPGTSVYLRFWGKKKCIIVDWEMDHSEKVEGLGVRITEGF